MNLAMWVGVMLIGGVGSVARFMVDGAIASRTDRAFPLGTLGVNLSGAALLGLVTGLALSHESSLLAGTAAIGSYTTFSTWMFETQRLGEEGETTNLVANILVSVVAGVVAAALGRAIGGAL